MWWLVGQVIEDSVSRMTLETQYVRLQVSQLSVWPWSEDIMVEHEPSRHAGGSVVHRVRSGLMIVWLLLMLWWLVGR